MPPPLVCVEDLWNSYFYELLSVCSLRCRGLCSRCNWALYPITSIWGDPVRMVHTWVTSLALSTLTSLSTSVYTLDASISSSEKSVGGPSGLLLVALLASAKQSSSKDVEGVDIPANNGRKNAFIESEEEERFYQNERKKWRRSIVYLRMGNIC